MVFGPIGIFRFSRRAARTSASQTKSTGSSAGSAGEGAGVAEQDAPAPVVVSQLNPVFCRERNRSTTSAARFETVETEEAEPAAAAGMPRAAR